MRQRKYVAYDKSKGEKIAEAGNYDILLDRTINFLVRTGVYPDELEVLVCSESPPRQVRSSASLKVQGCTEIPGWEYDLIDQLIERL